MRPRGVVKASSRHGQCCRQIITCRTRVFGACNALRVEWIGMTITLSNGASIRGDAVTLDPAGSRITDIGNHGTQPATASVPNRSQPRMPIRTEADHYNRSTDLFWPILGHCLFGAQPWNSYNLSHDGLFKQSGYCEGDILYTRMKCCSRGAQTGQSSSTLVPVFTQGWPYLKRNQRGLDSLRTAEVRWKDLFRRNVIIAVQLPQVIDLSCHPLPRIQFSSTP